MAALIQNIGLGIRKLIQKTCSLKNIADLQNLARVVSAVYIDVSVMSPSSPKVKRAAEGQTRHPPADGRTDGRTDRRTD